MTAQQSADQVQPFKYSHGTRAAAVVPSSSPTVPSLRTNTVIETTMSEGSAVSPSTSPPVANKKRKQTASPTDDAGGNGSDDARDGVKDQQQPSKKSRRELPPHTVAILKGWMLSREHVKHPYPTDEDKQMLLKKTGISMKQLTNWFTNARKRIWKPMMRREHSRQLQSAMEFDHTTVREFPGAGLSQQYADSSYAPRAAVCHSFDAGSLGAPSHPVVSAFDKYAQPQAFPENAPVYPTRPGRSMSEATRADDDNYSETKHLRERILNRGQDSHAPRNSLSPRGHKILQEWTYSNARREYPYPNATERLQLSKETGLDVSQVDGWVTSLREQMGTTLVRVSQSIPSAENPSFPPSHAFGKRRSIPASGNPIFPPRPSPRAPLRPSITPAGKSQFPLPSSRQAANDTYFEAFPSVARYPLHEMRMRSMTMCASPSVHLPPACSSAGSETQTRQQPVGNALPSLSSRSLMGRPPPIVTSNGLTMGQPRDSRSRTLDMGQFAEARRRKMNFQDILASTGGSTHSADQAAPTRGTLLPASSHLTASNNDVENVYPNGTSITTYEALAPNDRLPKHSSVTFEQRPGRVA